MALRPPAARPPSEPALTAPRALFAALGVALSLGLSAPAAAQSQLEVLERLESLELTIQRLTAQVEQMDFERRAAERQADARLQDLEFRVIELEGGDPTEALRRPPADAAPADAAPNAPVAATPAAQGATPPPPRIAPRAPLETAPETPPETPLAPEPQTPAAASQPTAPGPQPLGTLRGAIPPAERAAFEAAKRDLETLGPAAGRDSFAAFLTDHPDSALAGEAQNLVGGAYAREGRHQEAARSFLIGVRDYGHTPKAADNLLGLASALTDLGRQAEACSALAELSARFPDAAPSVKAQATAEARRAGCR